MRGKFLKMDPHEFLDEFLPDKSNAAQGKRKQSAHDCSRFESVDAVKTEKELQKTFIDCFEENRQELCPHYILVDTKDKPDELKSTMQRVDACLFHETMCTHDSKDLADGEKQSPNWDLHKLHIEFKKDTTLDAFTDRGGSFEGKSEDSQDTRGQIISYAALVFTYQPRTFFFTLLVLGSKARILRWDRAGAIVTERFDYMDNCEILCNFFQRFSCLSEEEQGIDTTVQLVTKEEREMMQDAASDDNKLDSRDYARVFFAKSLKLERQWWKVPVHVSSTVTRYFLVGTPRFYAEGMVGRGTRGYVALNPKYLTDGSPKFVWLKDAWRVDHQGIEQEGKILEHLNAKGVKNVPTLLCHGDVDGQHTATEGYSHDVDSDANPLKSHMHYRMVVREVGRSLKSFKNGYELVLIIYHCIVAHMSAYTLAGILHRDVSTGNILIVEPECKTSTGAPGLQGVLTDWELSRSLKETTKRQPHRTGTWQFMSAALLLDNKKNSLVQDDLESFFHVLLYTAARYLKHNLPPQTLTNFMDRYFDETTYLEDGATGGEFKRVAIGLGQISFNGISFKLAPADKHPLNDIITKLLSWLKAYYAASMLEAREPSPTSEQTDPGCELDPADQYVVQPQHHEVDIPSSPDVSSIGPEEKRLAAMLDSHNAFLTLLWKAMKLKHAWLADDRCGDQLLPNFKPGKQKHYDDKGSQLDHAAKLKQKRRGDTGSFSKHSKRSRNDEDDEQPRSKRSHVTSSNAVPSRARHSRAAKSETARRSYVEYSSSEESKSAEP